MMRQLANAAKKADKSSADLKSLMLSASQLLDTTSDSSKFASSIKALEETKWLPCISSSGALFCSMEELFFIVDNADYANMFRGKLVLLDFSYEQLSFLHELLRVLDLLHRYLGRHVSRQTFADSSVVDIPLTEQFRQCAYPLSW